MWLTSPESSWQQRLPAMEPLGLLGSLLPWMVHRQHPASPAIQGIPALNHWEAQTQQLWPQSLLGLLVVTSSSKSVTDSWAT